MSEYITLNDDEMWFGNVPEHWGIKRIGHLYHERKQKVSDKDYTPLSVTMHGILPQLEHAAKTDAHDDRKLIRKGDFVINSRSDRRGSCGISPSDGSCSLINTVLEPRTEMNPSYYDWFFHTVRFAEEFYRWGHGIHDDLWTTSYDEMKRIFLPVPPLSEQAIIASYLDSKCSAIDEAIERHKKIIEKLEEYKRTYIIKAVSGGYVTTQHKLSAIPWIVSIPVGWNETPLKYIFREHKNKNNGMVENNLLSLSYGHIKRKDINTNEGLLPESFEGYNIVEAGDIVLRLTDLQNDKKSLRTGLVTERGIVTSAYITLRPTKDVNSAYFRYLLHAYDLRKVFYTMGEGIRQSLKFDDIAKGFILPVPPRHEQDQICDEIVRMESWIDASIAKRKEIIDKLTEYKKSIIYNAVTGKIDCRAI